MNMYENRPLRKVVGGVDWNWRKQRVWRSGDAEWIIQKTLLACGHVVNPPRISRIEWREHVRCYKCSKCLPPDVTDETELG